MDTLGDIIIGGALGATTKLAGNTTTTRKFLMSVGVSGAALAQTYETLLAGDIPDIAITQVTSLQTALDQKLSDNLLVGQIFIGNPSDLATGVIPSGDWVIDTAGVATIEPNAVTFDKFQQATGPQILVGTPDILGVQDFRQITLDPATLQIDASGMMSSIATGTGTVTNTNTLTLNSLVLGDGGTAIKVGGGFTTDGVSQLTLGVIGTSVGGLLLTNLTSGTVELRPVTGALGTTVLSLFAGSDTLVGLAATQTLTNKTLTNPQINGALLQTSSTVGYVWTATNTTGAGSWQAATGGGGTTTNSLTINNSGTGAASGTTFNGSVARTISSNTILPSFTGNNGLYLRLNSSTGLPEWASATGSGTVSSGTQYQLAYYAANGTTVSGLTLITASRALVSDANGLPIASTVSTTQLQYLASATGTTGTTSTNLVFSTSPTLVTPTLGAALATSINGLTITSTTGTLTLDSGSTLATSGAFSTTLTATATTALTLPTAGTLATLAGTETFTNKTLNGPKIGSTGGQGHFHMHSTNSVPTGLTNYITVFGDVSPNKKMGFLFETDGFESYFQFNATSTDKTYTFPDATGTVALINASNYLSVPKSGAVSGGIIFEGGTSGTISFEAPLIAGTQSYIFPSAYPAASSGYYLTSTDTGTLAWNLITGGGDVTGPASSVDGNFAVFDSTTGKIIKESAGASLSAAGAAVFNTSLALGVVGPGGTTGQLVFRNATTLATTTLQASTSQSANLSYTWPILAPTVGQILSSDASGNLSWTAAGAGDMTLAGTQTVTGTKTFNAGAIRINNAANNGYHILASLAGSGGTLTATFPAATGTVPFLSLAQTFSALQSYSAGVTVSGGVTTFSHPPTTSTPISISGQGSTTNPHISFTGATINWMSFGTTGIAAPTLINAGRSAGTKVVIIQGSVAATLDSAIGGESLGMWLSSAQAIRFYTNASTTVRAAFDGDASNSNLTLTNATAVSIVAVTATTANVFNTIATTVNMAGAATTLNINNNTLAQTINIGTTSTQASFYNFGTGATVSGVTKAINIGTGGAAGSTTNITFGTSATTNLRFFGSANTSGKPTVSGSRGGNAALASFLTAMSNLGLITDSTTA
jgi:hypothetical protein